MTDDPHRSRPVDLQARGWLMTSLLVLGLTLLVLAVASAVPALSEPAESSENWDENWDGFGLIIAAWLAVPGALLTLVGSIGGRWVRRRRQSASAAAQPSTEYSDGTAE